MQQEDGAVTSESTDFDDVDYESEHAELVWQGNREPDELMQDDPGIYAALLEERDEAVERAGHLFGENRRLTDELAQAREQMNTWRAAQEECHELQVLAEGQLAQARAEIERLSAERDSLMLTSLARFDALNEVGAERDAALQRKCVRCGGELT